MSENFVLPSVSTQLLLREGVNVPEHFRHLPTVSQQLQVLAMFFFLGLFLSEDGGKLHLVSWLLRDSLLLDRHGAPAMTRDSGCLAVHVDGVFAVDCNRQKVLDALDAAKATLDAAGLQCSEVESDTSKQVFTGLQLNHETGILSLEASRILRLRRGLEFATRQRHLTGDRVAKLIGHITWSCLLRCPALSLTNAGHRLTRTLGPRGGLWPAVAQEFRWIASLLPLGNCNLTSPWSPWVYATDESGGARGGNGVTRRWCVPGDVSPAGRCAEWWRFSAEESISARRSVLVDSELPPLRVACKRVFSQPGASCLAVSGGNRWRSCGEKAKLLSWGCDTRDGLLKARGNVFRLVVVAPQASITRVAKFVSSLLPRSPSITMLTNVWRLQRGQPLIGAACCPPSRSRTSCQ